MKGRIAGLAAVVGIAISLELGAPALAQSEIAVPVEVVAAAICPAGFRADNETFVCGQPQPINRPIADVGECVMDLSLLVAGPQAARAYTGDFLGDGSQQIIVPYSGCEPHVGGFQGALIYAGGDLEKQLPSWLIAAPFQSCAIAPAHRGTGGDALLCLDGGGNQGVLFSGANYYWLEPDSERNAYLFASDPAPVVEALSVVGMQGAEVVDCSAPSSAPIFVDVTNLRPASAGQVRVDVTYIAGSDVPGICAEGFDAPNATFPPMDTEAFVNPRHIRHGTLLIDIASGSTALE